MSRSVILLASVLTLLPLCAQAAANNPPVDARTDSALVAPVDDGRSAARPTPPNAAERTYDKAMDWSASAAGAPTQGRPDEAAKPVSPVSSAAERGGESLLNWASDVGGNKNASNKPKEGLPRHTMKTSTDVAQAQSQARKARAIKKKAKGKNETRELNLAQEQQTSTLAAPSSYNAPVIFTNTVNPDGTNPPVTQSNQYDPNNKPVIYFGNEAPAAETLPTPTLAVPAKAGKGKAAQIVKTETVAPLPPTTLQVPPSAMPRGSLNIMPVQAVDVGMRTAQPVPMIEEIAPVAPMQPQEPIVAAPPVSNTGKANGLTTPRIGTQPRIVAPASNVGLY